MVPQGRELEVIARSGVPRILSEALGTQRVHLRKAKKPGHDFDVVVEDRVLLVSTFGRSDRVLLRYKWTLARRAKTRANEIPVLVVPFMPAQSRALATEQRINWLDLSGNASIHAPGFVFHVSGNPDRFARRGRPSSVFERRSSRLARTLLQFPGREWSVREATRATGLNEGHVSRIVGQMVEDQLLARDARRHFHVREPGHLLEAWRDAANFSKHRTLRGHVPARSGEELLRALSARLEENRLDHAATGLAAAWLYDHFAMFRLVTMYVRDWPTRQQLEHLRFREEPNGANVWLVLPNDLGVFTGERRVDGVPCVHPVQVYVDLKDQPERAAEASEHLRANPILLEGGPGP